MTGKDEPRRVMIAPIAAFTLWAAAFVAIYAILSVGCRFGWEAIAVAGPLSFQRAVLVALFVLSVIAALAVIRCSGRRLSRSRAVPRIFLERVGLLAGWAALVSTVVTFGPVFFLSSCI